ncbi:MAG: glycosyltransferase family 2 protein, partial [Armatimonadota bacterium]|nr:glycosyltransferase family 2 protein [Armatimonadota bacterium]
MEAIFWISFALLLYTYAGYPLLLMIIGRFRRKPVRRKRIYPMLSVLIAAHNEQAGVRLKLANTLSLHYPKNRIEIILVSDGST